MVEIRLENKNKSLGSIFILMPVIRSYCLSDQKSIPFLGWIAKSNDEFLMKSGGSLGEQFKKDRLGRGKTKLLRFGSDFKGFL